MSGKGLVLLYHRVSHAMLDPQLLMVQPDRFAEHLALLSDVCTPMPLAEMMLAAKANDLPSRAVALTFDDGYADNVLFALPLLEKHQVPATVFAVSGMVGAHHEFWWDELERLLLTPGMLPREFSLSVGGENVALNLGESARYTEKEAATHAGWSVLAKDDPSPRHILYRAMYTPLLRLDGEQRWKVLGQLRDMARFSAQARETHRAMNMDEARRVAQSSMTVLGAHTVHHPRLSELSDDAKREEVATSRSQLEDMVKMPVREFSYPYGGRADYDSASVQAVRDSGFELAVSNFPGLVGSGTDCWQIPRHIVRDVTAQELGASLDGWFANC